MKLSPPTFLSLDGKSETTLKKRVEYQNYGPTYQQYINTIFINSRKNQVQLYLKRGRNHYHLHFLHFYVLLSRYNFKPAPTVDQPFFKTISVFILNGHFYLCRQYCLKSQVNSQLSIIKVKWMGP